MSVSHDHEDQCKAHLQMNELSGSHAQVRSLGILGTFTGHIPLRLLFHRVSLTSSPLGS